MIVNLILHLAFMMAVVIYAGLAHFLFEPSTIPEADPVFKWVILGLGVVSAPMGFVVPRIIGRVNRLDARQLLIVTDAFFEAIAIYGFVGIILGVPVTYCYPLMGLSFALLAFQTFNVVR